MAKKSFRQILRERERERERKKKKNQLQKMPDLDDPIYEKLEPAHIKLKDRPPEAPDYFEFLVDGHNCIYALSKRYDAAWNFVRSKFLELIRKYRDAMLFYYDLTIDFNIYMDNYQSKMSHESIAEGITIYNCATRFGRDAADIEIVEIVRFDDYPEELLVASSDGYCREVEELGATLFTSHEFLELIRTQLPPDYIEDYDFR